MFCRLEFAVDTVERTPCRVLVSDFIFGLPFDQVFLGNLSRGLENIFSIRNIQASARLN